jgi:hypothetical protein
MSYKYFEEILIRVKYFQLSLLITTQHEREKCNALIQWKCHKIPDFFLSLSQIAYSCVCPKLTGAGNSEGPEYFIQCCYHVSDRPRE